MKAMFTSTLTNLMRQHDDIITITADMGFSVFEEMQKEFPLRFINTGVTEQGSTGFASGMALSGYKVFLYAQAVFASMRCYEQMRLDVAYNFLNVKIIGVNAGFSLNQLGVSHFSLEDVALMRLLPNMTVLSPGDPIEMEWAVKKAYEIDGPVYIRYSKMGTETIHNSKTNFLFGQPIRVCDGSDAVLFVCGGLISMAKAVALKLKQSNIFLAVYSVPTIKPLDAKSVLKAAQGKKNIFTLEEHSINGGLGTAIGDILMSSDSLFRLRKFGVPATFTRVTGSIEYLLKINGISVDNITFQISSLLRK